MQDQEESVSSYSDGSHSSNEYSSTKYSTSSSSTSSTHKSHSNENIFCPICHATVSSLETFQCCSKCKDALDIARNFNLDNLQSQQISNMYSPDLINEASNAISQVDPGPGCGCSKSARRRRGMRKYYTSLNSWIEELSDLQNEDDGALIEKDKNEASFKVRCATIMSFFINFCLLCGKAFALSTSTSNTLISSLADSALDLVAGIIISCSAAHSKFTREDLIKYPVGKSRVSTVGILVFSVLMSCCAAYIIIECVMSLINHVVAPKATLGAVIVMFVTIGVKLAMWIIYRCIGHPFTITLSEDHRNDVLTNALGLFMYWGGSELGWWMDSVGGILLSLFVLISWILNATENAKMLMGASAPPEVNRALTYIAAHHHPLILGVEQVISFQVGPQYFAELHIVVPGHIPLEIAHWVGESLQLRVEKLSYIERAWVHVDCEEHDENEHLLFMRATGKIGKQKNTDESEQTEVEIQP
ncbi:cation efflux family protein [Histomonas meleagridis]|uniref:cation efflux family protein n=1 Tax=Histomonas meleagridis TaxID=135588 RepID=UPI00355A2869|nr:cation efflux family protein [Histomonas meleagridis]KAH0801907.1 cation efflux family protein [Histomonas meleagridis]